MLSLMKGLGGAFAALLLGAGYGVGVFVACTGEGGDVGQGDAGQSDASDIDLVCPPERPDHERACKSGLDCYYGEHEDCLCPPDQGIFYYHRCVGGVWVLVEKGECGQCPDGGTGGAGGGA